MALVLTGKRKRYSPSARTLAVYRPRAVTPYKRRRFVAGVDRTGGYYGRYSGRSGELKFHDVELDDAVVNAAGTTTPTINIIAQGNTESERIGRKSTIKSINWRYSIHLVEQDAVATPESGDSCRVILYLDKQCNGATAAVTQVLEATNIHSFRNLANSQRFVFLLDRTHSLNYMGMASDGAGLVSQGEIVKQYSWYKKCNIPIEYDDSATTGVITSIRSNNLGVLLISAKGLCLFDSKIRLRFSDY